MRLNGLAEWFARHRLLLLGLVAAMTAVGVFGLTRLGFDDLPLNIFRTDQSDFALLEELFADFGSDDRDCVIVVESDQLFSPRGVTLLRQLADQISKIDAVESVQSIDDVAAVVTSFDATFLVRPAGGSGSILPTASAAPEEFVRARRELLAHPMVAGQLISKDARTALIIARIRGDSLPISELKPVVLAIQETLDRLAVPTDLARVRLTGVPPIRYEIFSSIRRDSMRFMILGTVLAFLMGTILFRRFWAVITVSTPPLLAAMWTVGLLGLMGEKFNVINTILPVLVMIVGFTDSVHLMFDVRHSLARGLSPLDAAKSSIEHLGIACALTSFTTAIGFASLMVTDVEVIRKLGLVCGIGAVLAFVSTIILVPLWASSPIGPLLAANKAGLLATTTTRINHRFKRLAMFTIDKIITHAGLVTIAGIVVMVLLAALATKLAPNNRLTENIPDSNESAQALFHVDEAFGGLLPSFVLIDWDEGHTLESDSVIGAIADATRMIEEHPGTNHPISVIRLLQTLPGSEGDLKSRIPLLWLLPQDLVRRFVRTDRRRAVVVFYMRDLGAGVHEPTFRDVEKGIREIENRYDGVQLNLTGTAVVASRNINQMISDLAKSVGLATIVIFATMTLVFRSWKLGLISLLPNAFPLLATAAWLVITGRPLELTSVIVFSICLGIAVDDTIHVINRFQRERAHGHGVRAAIQHTLIAVGSALATTTAVLMVGFASVSISELPTTQLFAELGALAIFAALIGDLVILPAMIVYFLAPRIETGQEMNRN